MKNCNYSPETVKQRKSSLDKFLVFSAEYHIERFHDVSLNDLETYRIWMQDHNLNDNTIETHLRAIRVLFNYLEEQSLLFENPTTPLIIKSRRKVLPKVISVKQVHHLLNAPDPGKSTGIRDQAILELLYATGMRRKEIL